MSSPPFFYISMLAVIDKVLYLWYFVYNVSFFSSKPKQRFPTEHENFADKCDGLFTWRCLDIMYNLDHITLSSQYVIVSMSLSHNTAPLVFMAWWEIRYNWNQFFTSESWQNQTWQLALTGSVCRDVTGSLVLVTSIPQCQCLGYVNATKPCMFLCFTVCTCSIKVDEYHHY